MNRQELIPRLFKSCTVLTATSPPLRIQSTPENKIFKAPLLYAKDPCHQSLLQTQEHNFSGDTHRNR